MSQEPPPPAYPGMTVYYTLTEADAQQINRQRTTSESIAARIAQRLWPLGAQPHIGPEVLSGEVLPLIVVRGGHGFASGQVLLPGNDQLWVEGVAYGGGPGRWQRGVSVEEIGDV